MVFNAQPRIGRSGMAVALCCALLGTAVPRTGATTIEPMTLVTAAEYAAQVIDARVLTTKSRWVENPRRIETVVSLTEVLYLKGGNGTVSSTFELVVPGGTMGSFQMRIAGAPEFHPGDRWILFLLPSYKTFPVVGLTQGAFRIDERTPATTRVLDASGRGVVAVRRNGVIDVTGAQRTSIEQRLKETYHARIRNPPRQSTRAMTVDEFVAALRPILSVSRRYDLSRPAGQPDPSPLRPTTLKPSEHERRQATTRDAKARRGRTVTGAGVGSDSKGRKR